MRHNIIFLCYTGRRVCKVALRNVRTIETNFLYCHNVTFRDKFLGSVLKRQLPS